MTLRRVIARLLIVLAIYAQLSACGGATPVRRWDGPIHRVQRGETMYSISKRYGLTVDDLADLNDIDDPAQIRVGQRLRLPKGTRAIAASRGGAGAPRRAPERATPPKPRGPGKYAGRFIWPVQPAKVTSGFGMRDGAMHNGLDLSAPKGTPIRAAADGTVIYEGDGLSGYGNLIILDHGGGYTTIYAHNDDNRAALGARVRQGEVIGFVGETGRASAPHCHFEIRLKTRALNPLDYLP